MKKGFTLAETMIVLVVIGVLGAILLPVINKANPDSDLLRFKKAHETLLNAVQELAASDKYYLNGDLGIRADGQILNASDVTHRKYFCETLSDVLDTKYSDCAFKTEDDYKFIFFMDKNLCDVTQSTTFLYNNCNGLPLDQYFHSASTVVDNRCKKIKPNAAKQIITKNDIWFWEPYQKTTFGHRVKLTDGTGTIIRMYVASKDEPAIRDAAGNGLVYKMFCMDIDGVPDNATEEDCINECPFGFGIRADGRVVADSRASEWLQRSVIKK